LKGKEMLDDTTMVLGIALIGLWVYHKVKTSQLKSKIKKYENLYGKL
jgi:hypothetical protein